MLSQGKTMKLDEVVGLVLKQMGVDKKYKECEVSQIWPEVVGKMIASRTKSLKMADGKLIACFTSAVVRNELLMVKEGLISALNAKLGEDIVKDIIIK